MLIFPGIVNYIWTNRGGCDGRDMQHAWDMGMQQPYFG